MQPQQQQQQSCVTVLNPGTHHQPQQQYTGPNYTAATRRVPYDSRQSVGIGITLTVLGVLAIVFNAVGLAVADVVGFVAHGFWGGIFFIVTGSFGAAAGTQKTKCPIITFMVLCILSAIMTIGLLSAGIAGAATAAACDKQTNSMGYYCNQDNSYYPSCGYSPPCHANNKWRAAVVMEACLAIVGLIAAILCIWGSAICCKAVCCCSTRIPGVVLSQHGNEAMVIVSSQQQHGMPYLAAGPAQQIPPYCIAAQAPPAYNATGGGGYQYWMPQYQHSSVPPQYNGVFYQSAPSAPYTAGFVSATNPNYTGPAIPSVTSEQQAPNAVTETKPELIEKF